MGNTNAYGFVINPQIYLLKCAEKIYTCENTQNTSPNKIINKKKL